MSLQGLMRQFGLTSSLSRTSGVTDSEGSMTSSGRGSSGGSMGGLSGSMSGMSEMGGGSSRSRSSGGSSMSSMSGMGGMGDEGMSGGRGRGRGAGLRGSQGEDRSGPGVALTKSGRPDLRTVEGFDRRAGEHPTMEAAQREIQEQGITPTHRVSSYKATQLPSSSMPKQSSTSSTSSTSNASSSSSRPSYDSPIGRTSGFMSRSGGRW